VGPGRKPPGKIENMTFFRILLFLCPVACLLAQTPPPPPAPAGTPQNRVVNPDGSVTLTLPIHPAPAQVPPEKVILTVGDLTITAKQFDEITDGMQDQYKAYFKGPGRKQFADQLVKVLSLAEEGKRRKLDETSSYKSQAMYQDDQALANSTFMVISKEAKIDDAAMHAYYDAHKADYEQIHVRHILIRMHGSTVPVKPGEKDLSEAEALAKTQDLEQRLKAGDDFATLAGAESDDSTSTNGGDLGTVPRGRMVPSFDEAAFKLAPGQISEPVKSQFGYHIIKVDSKETKSFDDMKPEIEKKMRPEEAKKAMDALEKSTKVVYDDVFFGLAKQ
jgi:peptidyl-prolyl cis-trans isomerase C